MPVFKVIELRHEQVTKLHINARIAHRNRTWIISRGICSFTAQTSNATFIRFSPAFLFFRRTRLFPEDIFRYSVRRTFIGTRTLFARFGEILFYSHDEETEERKSPLICQPSTIARGAWNLEVETFGSSYFPCGRFVARRSGSFSRRLFPQSNRERHAISFFRERGEAKTFDKRRRDIIKQLMNGSIAKRTATKWLVCFFYPS